MFCPALQAVVRLTYKESKWCIAIATLFYFTFAWYCKSLYLRHIMTFVHFWIVKLVPENTLGRNRAVHSLANNMQWVKISKEQSSLNLNFDEEGCYWVKFLIFKSCSKSLRSLLLYLKITNSELKLLGEHKGSLECKPNHFQYSYLTFLFVQKYL